MQIPLVFNSEVDDLCNQNRIDLAAHYYSCGIRQEVAKAIDKIAQLRAEMNKERAKHDLQMAEMLQRLMTSLIM